jgi:hypothetical protein
VLRRNANFQDKKSPILHTPLRARACGGKEWLSFCYPSTKPIPAATVLQWRRKDLFILPDCGV